MKRIILTVCALGVTLACGGTFLATPTPQVTPMQAVGVPEVTPSPAPSPTLTAPAKSPTSAAQSSTATILRPAVNLRDEPGGVVIGTLAAGDVVTVLECKDNWCKVSLLEQTGYIYRGCLSGNDDLGCEAR